MDIKLNYHVEKDVQYVDVHTGEPTGLPFDEHQVIAEVNGQIFRQNFVVKTQMKAHNHREEAFLFGKSLVEIGKMIARQADRGVEGVTIMFNGQRQVTF